LELVVVASRCTWRIKVTGRAWCVVARATVVELAGWTGTLALSISRLTIAVTSGAFAAAWGTVIKLGAFAIACGTVAHAVSAHMAAGTRGSAI
jgi:hypothetical protein